MLSEPVLATPTKILDVATPFDPLVESNVTNEIPSLSLLYPLVSDGSGTYVPSTILVKHCVGLEVMTKRR